MTSSKNPTFGSFIGQEDRDREVNYQRKGKYMFAIFAIIFGLLAAYAFIVCLR